MQNLYENVYTVVIHINHTKTFLHKNCYHKKKSELRYTVYSMDLSLKGE